MSKMGCCKRMIAIRKLIFFLSILVLWYVVGLASVFAAVQNRDRESNESSRTISRTSLGIESTSMNTERETHSVSTRNMIDGPTVDSQNNETESIPPVSFSHADLVVPLTDEEKGEASQGTPWDLITSQKGFLGPENISTTLKTLLITSAFSLAPALLLITTSYIRISVVFSLLRQAIGAGQIPSNQIISVLSIFLTVLIMAPVWTQVYEEAIMPYSTGEMTNTEALQQGQAPIRTFLWKQIEHTGGAEAVSLFLKYIPESEIPEYYEDVPWKVLAPAFVLSELKTAFLIGFQLFIPFLIIDIIVASVLVSAGMMMLPPAIVSLPFKLALFVLVDGWTLVVKSLIESFV